MSHLGAQVSLDELGDSLFLLCPARRLALNALCPMDRDWHVRSQTQPTGRRAEGFTPWLQAKGSGCREETLAHRILLGDRWEEIGQS